jgi:hypothetical protein
LLIVVLSLFATGRADAEPTAIEVTGDSCAPATVSSHLAELIGEHTHPAISIAWTTDDSGIHASVLVASDALHEREIVVATCEELNESLSLMVGMVLTLPSSPAAKPAEPIVIEYPPIERPAATRQLSVLTSASVTQRSTPILSAGVRFHRSSLAIAVELEASTAEQVDLSQGSVRISYRGARVATCWEHGPLDTCAVVRSGWVSGEGSGYAEPVDAASFDAAAGLNLGWRLPLSSILTLRPFVEGVAWATRNRFRVDDMQVWSNGTWEGRIGLMVDASIL